MFLTSTYAYDANSDWVRGELAARFRDGDGLYDDALTSSSGLGPVYAGYACGSCHRNAGRTTPSVWTKRADGAYGSGDYGFSSMLIYITRRNGAFFQNYGRVLHDQSIYGVQPEGKLKVDWRYEKGQFPDGETYELAAPTYTITDWYMPGPDGRNIRPDELFCTVRIPLRHVGLGQMMALDPKEIEALARKSNYPEYGISGRANYIFERGRMQLGLSGNKAQHADLTVELGFSSDMGATNSRFPEEISEGQRQIQEGGSMGLRYHKLDVSTRDMEDVDLYLHTLGVPARRNVNDPEVKHGERMFYQAKCHLCHVTTLRTRPPRHGQRNHGRRPERQLCERTGPRQRMAHHAPLGYRAATNGERPHLLPPRRPRPQCQRGHPLARRGRRSLEAPLHEDEKGRSRSPHQVCQLALSIA